MMGFGFLTMILALVLPVVIIVGLVIWLGSANRTVNPFNMDLPVENHNQIVSQKAGRFCTHCGAGLQDGWSHCPQCGAPVKNN